jgi:hypothetical protein
MLFLKRLSDLFDQEREKVAKKLRALRAERCHYQAKGGLSKLLQAARFESRLGITMPEE